MAEFPCPHCQTATVKTGAAGCQDCGEPPVVCGHYRVEELLGKGGMGLVYAARDARDGRAVAVKLLSLKGVVDWKVYELFERSTTVLRGLEHRALPRIDAFEKTAAGALVLVRERFDGGNLEQRVLGEKRTLGAAELRKLLRSLLELLVYLHGRSPPVLHRDIKASNIMFRSARDWDPVLVDFDTIAAPGSQDRRTTLVVSPGYTAPEQYAGDVSPASDLYSLGATMLLAATGVHPDELPRRDGRFVVERRLGQLEPDLRQVVLKLVEPEKRARYARAEEALADLQTPKPAVAGRPFFTDASDDGRTAPKQAPPPKRKKKKPPAAPDAAAAKGAAAGADLPRRRLLLGLCWLVALAVGALGFVFPGELATGASVTIGGLGTAFAWMALRQRVEKDDEGRTALIATGVALAVMGGLVAGQIYYWKYRDGLAAEELKRSGAGIIDHALAVPGSGPEVRLLIVDHVTIEYDSWYRLNLVDAASGRRLARRTVGREDTDCAPTAPGTIWCATPSRPLLLLDGSTLATIADYAELRRRSSDLGEKPIGAVSVDRLRGDAFLPMPDGRNWRVDPNSLRAEPLSEEAAAELESRESSENVQRLGSSADATTSTAERLDGTFSFQSTSGRRERLAFGDQIVSADDFLDPSFVVDEKPGWPLTVPGSSGFLVQHKTSLDYAAARVQLSAVSPLGPTLWTIVPDIQELLLATVVVDTIVIVGKQVGDRGLVWAISAADGSTRWALDR